MEVNPHRPNAIFLSCTWEKPLKRKYSAKCASTLLKQFSLSIADALQANSHRPTAIFNRAERSYHALGKNPYKGNALPNVLQPFLNNSSYQLQMLCKPIPIDPVPSST
jgi:hypothetical protein